MRRWFAVCLLSGCGFSVSNGGNAGQPIDAAPRPIDAPLDPDLDEDDDGVLNAADNCPAIANPMQFNEDADAHGDECDPCPQLAAAGDDADGDADGVGDGCDPHPTVAGDKLAYWNGFHEASTTPPAALTTIHGSAARWSISNDRLEFKRVDEDWSILAFETLDKNHTTDAVLDITASYGTLAAAAAGVAVDVASNDDDAFDCQARIDSPRRELWYWNGRGLGAWTELNTVSTTTPLGSYRIVLERTPTDLYCKTTRNNASVQVTSTADTANRTRAGVFARNVDVRFSYIAIYTSP